MYAWGPEQPNQAAIDAIKLRYEVGIPNQRHNTFEVYLERVLALTRTQGQGVVLLPRFTGQALSLALA